MVRLQHPFWKYVKEKYPHIGVGMNPPYLPLVENRGIISPDVLFREIVNFVKGGGDFMTMNFVPQTLAELKKYIKTRKIPITSRQGGLLADYMERYHVDNPYHTILSNLLPILREYNVTVNIGSTFRPAGIAEAYDEAHRWEIRRQMKMHKLFDEAGVQSIVEIMSHQPLHQIGSGILKIRKEYGGYVPFQFLGPIVTDIGGEYDYITSAIGAAEASRYNVGKVTVIPAREHAGFPTLTDIKKGIIAAKIAVHAGDLTRISSLIQEDKLILNLRAENKSCDPFSKSKGCDKCGPYCPLIIIDKYLNE